MLLRPEAKTLAESAFFEIKSDILRSRFPPGHWLRLDELRETYGISISPLREALSRLISTGLVTAEGQRGFRVAEMSSENLIDIIKTRIWVEDMALRSAILSGDRRWEAEIVAATHRLGDGPNVRKTGSTYSLDDDWEVNHRSFHNALVAACTSKRLLIYRERLYEESDRYRRVAARQGSGGRDVAGEHRAIVEAILARDASKASRLMQDHLLATMKLVLEFSVGDQSKVTQLIKKAREETQTLLA
jgi:GntR family transcriptional regulator, carbon starvation induced regulator